MKIRVPGTILATSLNLGAIVNTGLPQDAVAANYPNHAQGDVSAAPNVASVIHASAKFYTQIDEVPLDVEWDAKTEKRFQSLAVKEAVETLDVAELLELEQLTIVRRKQTAPPVSTAELLEELRQWQSGNRVFDALARYVEEIGLRREAIANRP